MTAGQNAAGPSATAAAAARAVVIVVTRAGRLLEALLAVPPWP